MVITSRSTSAACGTESGAPWPSPKAEPSAQYSEIYMYCNISISILYCMALTSRSTSGEPGGSTRYIYIYFNIYVYIV